MRGVRGSCLEDILGDVPGGKPNLWILSVSRYSELSRACRMIDVSRLTNNLAAIPLRTIHGSHTGSYVSTEFGFQEFSLYFPVRGHEMSKTWVLPIKQVTMLPSRLNQRILVFIWGTLSTLDLRHGIMVSISCTALSPRGRIRLWLCLFLFWRNKIRN